MKRLPSCVAWIASLSVVGCFIALAPSVRTEWIAEREVQLDSGGVEIPLDGVALRGKSVRLCMVIDTTAYVVKQNDNDPYMSVRPRRATDVSYLAVNDRVPAHLDSAAITVRAWVRPSGGDRLELSPDGGAIARAVWSCFSGRAVPATASLTALHLQSSKPFITGGIAWHITSG